MCCFARPVISVNKTQIFARLSGNGTQHLAYQMNYVSDEPNAMILPLPVRQPAGEDTVRFIDLKGYESFFEDLAKGFPYRARPSGIACSGGPAVESMDKIEVFEVGNYIASFVPTISDFDRLDPKFRLPNEVWTGIPGYKNFGFAVFQLAAGSLKPHPMALEFQTQKDNQEIFFPTIHIHDGQVHQSEEFDHALYLQHAALDSKVSNYKNYDIEDEATGLVRSENQASNFAKVQNSAGVLNGDLLLHKKTMQGMLPNTDTIFKLSGDPITPSLNFRALASWTPLLVAFAAVGWFFNRRSKLKKSNRTKLARTDDVE